MENEDSSPSAEIENGKRPAFLFYESEVPTDPDELR